jgi:hypothetical protein
MILSEVLSTERKKKIRIITHIMMLQLNPMLPIVRVSDGLEGYAFLVIDYSQEHHILFTCAMDNGEIWTLNNKEIRFCKNISLDRK